MLYEKLERVGKGAFGEVYKCIHKQTGQIIAVKILNVDTEQDEISDIQKEVALLSQLAAAPGVTKYHGSYLYGTELWIVMDYAAGGSVRDLMKPGRIEERYIAVIVRNVTMALCHLHKWGIIHRDIKAANILLTEDGSVQLCDFGVAGQVTKNSLKRYSFVGTPYWMAPEVIQEGNQHDFKADIWSLGITTYEMAMGNPPFADQDPMRAIYLIPRSTPPRLPGDGPFSTNMKDFVASCLCHDPIARLASEDLMKTKFIKNTSKISHRILRELVVRRENWRSSNTTSEKKIVPCETVKNSTQDPADGGWEFDTVRTSSNGQNAPVSETTKVSSSVNPSDGEEPSSSHLSGPPAPSVSDNMPLNSFTLAPPPSPLSNQRSYPETHPLLRLFVDNKANQNTTAFRIPSPVWRAPILSNASAVQQTPSVNVNEIVTPGDHQNRRRDVTTRKHQPQLRTRSSSDPQQREERDSEAITAKCIPVLTITPDPLAAGADKSSKADQSDLEVQQQHDARDIPTQVIQPQHISPTTNGSSNIFKEFRFPQTPTLRGGQSDATLDHLSTDDESLQSLSSSTPQRGTSTLQRCRAMNRKKSNASCASRSSSDTSSEVSSLGVSQPSPILDRQRITEEIDRPVASVTTADSVSDQIILQQHRQARSGSLNTLDDRAPTYRSGNLPSSSATLPPSLATTVSTNSSTPTSPLYSEESRLDHNRAPSNTTPMAFYRQILMNNRRDGCHPDMVTDTSGFISSQRLYTRRSRSANLLLGRSEANVVSAGCGPSDSYVVDGLQRCVIPVGSSLKCQDGKTSGQRNLSGQVKRRSVSFSHIMPVKICSGENYPATLILPPSPSTNFFFPLKSPSISASPLQLKSPGSPFPQPTNAILSSPKTVSANSFCRKRGPVLRPLRLADYSKTRVEDLVEDLSDAFDDLDAWLELLQDGMRQVQR